MGLVDELDYFESEFFKCSGKMIEESWSCKNLITRWSLFAIDLEAALDHLLQIS